MDWANTLKNIKDIEVNVKQSFYIIGFLFVLCGFLCAFIGLSTCLHIVLIIGNPLSDGLAVLNPFMLAAIVLILGGWLICLIETPADYLPPLPKDMPAEWRYAFFKIKEKKKQRIRHYRRKINRRRLL